MPHNSFDIYCAGVLAYALKTTTISYWFVYIFPLYRMGDFAIGILLGFIYIDGAWGVHCIQFWKL